MVWKKVTNSDAGDSNHFGGDDVDKISLTFNAETQTDPINIKDENLYIVDPADTAKKVRFDAGGITSSQTRVITIPDANITLASTVAASTSVAGLMSAADKTKLDAVEASATADQTNAQIVAAVEAGTDSNTFTDADHTKLNAVEASATADQSNAEIRTAVEAATDSNVFTDADHSKLNAVEASADVTDATNVNAAGALMLSDTTTAGLGIVIDEDAMGSDSATKVPTQQSVVAYVASKIASSVTLKGNYNASSDSPSLDDGSPISGILAGDHYVVSTAGTFYDVVLQAGDSIISKQDSPTEIAHWITVNNNMVTPIVTANIAADAVTGAQIADDAINSEHITDGSVDLAHMSVNSIDSDQYVDASVDLAHLSADSVDGSKIVDDAINSEHYTNASIDLAHMSANSVDSDQYVDASIDLAHLAADSVDGSKIVDDAINSEHITDGSVDLAHMSVNSIDSDQYVDASIDLAHLAADSVDGSKIADDAIDSEHYAAGSIDVAHMSANSVDSDQYVDASIDLAHLAADSVDGSKIVDDAINSEHYTDASIDSAHLSTGLTIADPTLTFSIRADNSTAYVPVLADAGKIVTLGHGNATTCIIPTNNSVAFPVGCSLTWIQVGAGAVTISGISGVTVTSSGGTAASPVITAQHNSATAIKTATNTWSVIGAIE